MNRDELIELVAPLCHEQWSGWERYGFTKGEFNPDGSFIIDAESVKRWTRQMNTPYSELSEKEKESDRIEARKFIDLIVPLVRNEAFDFWDNELDAAYDEL